MVHIIDLTFNQIQVWLMLLNGLIVPHLIDSQLKSNFKLNKLQYRSMNSKFNYLNFQVQSRLNIDRPITSHVAIPIVTLSILLMFLSLGTNLFKRGV
jgi:hypothetical protein